MRVQEVKNRSFFIYIGRADAKELGWKKGDKLASCVSEKGLLLRKRGNANEK